MIKVFCETAYWNTIKEFSFYGYRLEEWVAHGDIALTKPSASAANLLIEEGYIAAAIDWQGMMPPYLLQEKILFKPEILMALVMLRLGELEKALELLDGEATLRAEVEFIAKLMSGEAIDPKILSVETYQEFDDYRLMHNHAVVRHYGNVQDQKQLEYFYKEAVLSAPGEEYAAFSAFHYFNYLFDNGRFEEAEGILRKIHLPEVSSDAKMKLQASLAHLHTQQLSPPYDIVAMEELKDKLWQCLTYYEIHGYKIEEAQCLMDAGQIATISESFAEALGYYTKAIKLFDSEGMEEFTCQAQLKKGSLLTVWAQKGNPQFFKPAMESYQAASRFFTKEYFPLAYAEIQENLGIIYSEIPDEAKKKSIWAAVSASSFLEALSVFTKEEFPYDYARVCNHYGIALLKYPQAVRSDNHVKALSYFQDALEIRDAENFPIERSLTLLNYLEACWHADNSFDEANPGRLYDMQTKVDELINIQAGDEFIQEARAHQAKLDKLKELLAEEGNL